MKLACDFCFVQQGLIFIQETQTTPTGTTHKGVKYKTQMVKHQ